MLKTEKNAKDAPEFIRGWEGWGFYIAGISINSMKGYNIKGGGKKWLR